MKKAALITKILIWVATAMLIGWDIVAAAWGEGASTISEILGEQWSWSISTLPLAWGVLTGHLFWIVRDKVSMRALRIGILSGIAIASIVMDVIDLYDIMPIIPALLGIPLGHFLWPQQYASGHPFFVWKSDSTESG
jgi:hypothetical protein